jgi:hypothetical protein
MNCEHKIIQINSEYLIVCFGGMALKMGGIPPFEFLNYLSKTYKNNIDLVFYVDINQCWYHKGIGGITNNIDETVIYLNTIINQKKYKKVIFMGVSAGGYASILFGSLCNIDNVIAYVPRTQFTKKMSDPKYFELKNVINNVTKYTIYGDTKVKDIHHDHHISQCINIENFSNVEVIRYKFLNMKNLRDTGKIKMHIDTILNSD